MMSIVDEVLPDHFAAIISSLKNYIHDMRHLDRYLKFLEYEKSSSGSDLMVTNEPIVS